MDNDRPDKPPKAATRADAIRERLRRAQVIAAQAARVQAAGGPPSKEESARLVAEFQAQGGRITVCPPAEDEAPDAGTKR